MSVVVVTAFVNLRRMALSVAGLARKVDELESENGKTRKTLSTPPAILPVRLPFRSYDLVLGGANPCYSAKSAKAAFATKHEPGEPRGKGAAEKICN
jgi:hypothetical protein